MGANEKYEATFHGVGIDEELWAAAVERPKDGAWIDEPRLDADEDECGTGVAVLWILCLTLGAVGLAAIFVLRLVAVTR